MAMYSDKIIIMKIYEVLNNGIQLGFNFCLERKKSEKELSDAELFLLNRKTTSR